MTKETHILVKYDDKTFNKLQLKKILWEDLNEERITWAEFIKKAVLEGVQ